MKVATFNINGVNGRLPALLAWLERHAPDIVCLQELKTSSQSFPVAALAEAGYRAEWKGQKSFNGVAILAKQKLPMTLRLSALPGDSEDLQARYIEAEVRGWIIACIYAPNGNPRPGPKFDYKRAWMERLRTHAKKLCTDTQPVLLCGDFNVVPTDEVSDIYSVRSWADDALLHPEPRAVYRQMLKDGWIDAVRHLYPDEPMYTFWDYMRNRWPRNAGLRIDFLLANAEASQRLRAVAVDREMRGREKASDHAPLAARFSRW